MPDEPGPPVGGVKDPAKSLAAAAGELAVDPAASVQGTNAANAGNDALAFFPSRFELHLDAPSSERICAGGDPGPRCPPAASPPLMRGKTAKLSH